MLRETDTILCEKRSLFLHIGDVHIQEDYEKTMHGFWEGILKIYKGEDLKPAIFITGDIVCDTKETFQHLHVMNKMLETMREKGYTVILVPGTHAHRILEGDHSPSMKSLQHDSATHEYPDCLQICRDPEVHVIILNSNSEDNDNGCIGDSQRTAMVKYMKKTGKAATIFVLLHHCPAQVNWAPLMKDADYFLECLRHGNEEGGRQVLACFSFQHDEVTKFDAMAREYNAATLTGARMSTDKENWATEMQVNFVERRVLVYEIGWSPEGGLIQKRPVEKDSSSECGTCVPTHCGRDVFRWVRDTCCRCKQ